jgi:hypothetical protein
VAESKYSIILKACLPYSRPSLPNNIAAWFTANIQIHETIEGN